jgi:hypothetical protein
MPLPRWVRDRIPTGAVENTTPRNFGFITSFSEELDAIATLVVFPSKMHHV